MLYKGPDATGWLAQKAADYCFSQEKADLMLSDMELSVYRFQLEDALNKHWSIEVTPESVRKVVKARSLIESATLHRLRYYAIDYAIRGRSRMKKQDLLPLVLEAFDKAHDDSQRTDIDTEEV